MGFRQEKKREKSYCPWPTLNDCVRVVPSEDPVGAPCPALQRKPKIPNGWLVQSLLQHRCILKIAIAVSRGALLPLCLVFAVQMQSLLLPSKLLAATPL